MSVTMMVGLDYMVFEGLLQLKPFYDSMTLRLWDQGLVTSKTEKANMS